MYGRLTALRFLGRHRLVTLAANQPHARFRTSVAVQRTALDDWADHATRLSGDDGDLDGVEELIVALRRVQAVDGIELTRLHSCYLDERDAA